MEDVKEKQHEVTSIALENCTTDAVSVSVNLPVQEVKEIKLQETLRSTNGQPSCILKKCNRWLLTAIFAILVLFSQSASTLLGRLYYAKGGNSKWLSGLIQNVGFPILLLLRFATANKTRRSSDEETNSSPSAIVLGSIYMGLGILVAAIGMLFSVGLLYLPVSTFSLISATQLGFNALFSFFLNSQKFTPYIVNSLVLLTISSALLVMQTDPSGTAKSSNTNYIVGFITTVSGSALYALMLSLTQLIFKKVLKRVTVKEVLDFLICPTVVGSCIITAGLFASGEWKTLREEMSEFKLGKTSYAMTLIWTAICWQIFLISLFGLIVNVSALFANVISTLGLPIVPVLAVFIFKDKMSGVKVISMLLGIWGFVSYIYQHYLDDLKAQAKSQDSMAVPEICLVQD